MDKSSSINKNSKEIFPMIISDISALKKFKKKEDSRKSSERISFSENYSLSNSSKGIQHYNFTKTQTKLNEPLKKSKHIFFSSFDFPEKKRKKKKKNKLITQTKYLNIFNSNKKNNNTSNNRKINFFQENKLNNNINIISQQSKKLKQKIKILCSYSRKKKFK